MKLVRRGFLGCKGTKARPVETVIPDPVACRVPLDRQVSSRKMAQITWALERYSLVEEVDLLDHQDPGALEAQMDPGEQRGIGEPR